MTTFSELGLSDLTIQALSRKGFEEPTPIQIKTIPAVLAGESDIVAQAQTGTGKTAAFGLPLLELLEQDARKVQALVLAPTRELAIQVAEEINSLRGGRTVSVTPIYGGQSMEIQLRNLRRGVSVVVGTPGRVLDHLRRGTLDLSSIRFLILDEADEMLNMGFLEDVTEIMEQTAADKRTMLFSATMPPEILRVAKKYMGDYQVIRAASEQLTATQTDQIYFEVSAADKFEALCRIIDMEEDFYGLVFTRTKVDADAVSQRLMERGYDADTLHGDMSQSLREKILAKFKKRLARILVATDVAARGIDVHDLTHVINFDLPHDPEAYVHRVGRTGRAGKEGIAITFITPSEYRRLQFISKQAKTDIRKARLPKVSDVIQMKKERIRAELAAIVATEPELEFLGMAQELLEQSKPRETLAALLQHMFQEELDASNYREIEDAFVVDKKGKTRLFVTQGRKDGLTPKRLLTFLDENCRIPSRKVWDIQIMETFAFVSLPFQEAEKVLSMFNRKGKDGGFVFTKAKGRPTPPPVRK
ncbi:DEAD/DEAH box helicase [Desulfomicrobium escambiense]|uniref:DEAD/DEAH box helicase n=1 Tax=Desulfomicrobium escambiense TaxID=29503 RepID=UPI00040DC1B1|nr:DEAD/DEAH box helicase [Desulfomicrobium escambiense]